MYDAELHRLSWFCCAGRWWLCFIMRTAGAAAAGYHLLSGLHLVQLYGRLLMGRVYSPSCAALLPGSIDAESVTTHMPLPGRLLGSKSMTLNPV